MRAAQTRSKFNLSSTDIKSLLFHTSLDLSLKDRSFNSFLPRSFVSYGSLSGTKIYLEWPWRRETMHNLVKELTGIYFSELEQDLRNAKDTVLLALLDVLEHKDKSRIGACFSLGHFLNELKLVQLTLNCQICEFMCWNQFTYWITLASVTSISF